METFFFRIGFTVDRPVVADQFFTNVVIQTDEGLSVAKQTAIAWVAACSEMVTSASLERVEI
jgi:hypothetical protein